MTAPAAPQSAEISSAVAAAAAGDTAQLEREHDALERKIRDTDAAIKREKDGTAAQTRKKEENAGDIAASAAEVKRLEAEVGRLRAGSLRAEETLKDMEEKLQQARMRPAA